MKTIYAVVIAQFARINNIIRIVQNAKDLKRKNYKIIIIQIKKIKLICRIFLTKANPNITIRKTTIF